MAFSRLSILLPLICFLCSCSSVHDARRTVAVADSLRVNEGVAYDDSLALAEAYSTTGRWRMVCSDDYARACYYYGRLLRNRGDQVAAMRAFISGTHAPYVQRVVPLPWFSDYHILGRIYSNMGTMCHFVDEFQLGCDMYEHSAMAFQKSCDTTAYYYALNAMALELAEQKLHDETLALLNDIEHECTDAGVLAKLWETRAILYYNLEQYDSTIYSVKQLQAHGNLGSTGYVKEAQAFDRLGQRDSALYYAKHVMSHPHVSNQDKYHVLYILINYDDAISRYEVQTLSSERADLDSELIEPLLQQLSVAVELLRQELNRKPSLQRIVLLLIILSLVGTGMGVALVKLKKNITNLVSRHQQLKKENEDIRQSSESIRQQDSARERQMAHDIENTCAIIRQYNNWDEELHWKDYKALCTFINQHFYLLADKLILIYHLEEKEIRLCILVLLDMDNKSIAKVIHYAPNGIGKYKYRIAQKLGTNIKNLRNCLIEIVAGK